MPSPIVDEAQSRLLELIDQLRTGVEIIITRGNQPVARLVAPNAEPPTPIFGSCKGMLSILTEAKRLRELKK